MQTFQQMGLAPEILRAIGEKGFEEPMPVQAQVIPALLQGDRDLVALAQTGTGKTAAFGLPLIQRIDTTVTAPQALVLAPTRELCLQIAGDLADFSKYMPDVALIPVYGGSSIEVQIRGLRRGVHIIIATPGRLIDLLERKAVHLDNVHTVVLDEADEMLNMGFVDSINDILARVPQDRKMLMFSATMPIEAARIARKYMHDHQEIVIGTRNEGADTVQHIYYLVHAHDKYATLKRVADNAPNIYGIIFCRTRRETQEVADALISDGYNADALHGDLSQQQRDIVMKKFRDGVISLLVATDVAARGLDVDNLTHVINYGLPDEAAIYTHRSGRTGRAGRKGVSIAIIHTRERARLRQIEQVMGRQFERREVPTPEHIIEKRLYNLADRLERFDPDQSEIDSHIGGVLKKLSWLSSEDILRRVFALEMNRLLEYYKDAPAIESIPDKPSKKDRSRADKADKPKPEHRRPATDAEKDRRTAASGYERVYISAGKADGFFASNLIDLLNHNVEGKRVDVGRIDLLPTYSLFDVRKADARRVVDALRNVDFFGRRLHCEIAAPDKDYARASTRKKRKQK